jgi:RecA-family ATPase
MTTSLEYALSYAKIGWAILPVWSCDQHGNCRCSKGTNCITPGKHPHRLAPHGHLEATTDENKIKLWYASDPDAGIGVACDRSELVVLDIDPRNGGYETLAEIDVENSLFISNCIADTQSGGEHRLFFQSDPNVKFPATLGPGLDIKYRGYICVEPTVGPSGLYKWRDELKPQSSKKLSPPPACLSKSANNFSSTTNDKKIRSKGVIVADEVYDELKAALAVIPPEIEYASWLKILFGMSRLAHLEKAKAITRNWSIQSTKTGHTPEAFDEKWAQVCIDASTTSYETIFYLANQHDRKWRDSFIKQINNLVTLTDPLAQPIRQFSMEELETAKLHPRVLVTHYLYADLRNLIAAGGVGKTTLLIHEAIHAALGLPIWGFDVPIPFRTVFITKEDPREIFAGRLREVMKVMCLSDREKLQVLSMVHVVDLRGDNRKLAHIKNDGQVTPDEKHLDALIKHILPANPDRIIFDPLVSFTVGESRVNEAEQGVVEAARYIMRKIPNVAVDVVHHTGKANARNMAMDQYAGRNGSALPDGSRMVAVMVEPSRDSFYEQTGIQLFASDGKVGLRMAFPKASYCQRPPDVYIIRNGFRFDLLPQITEVKRAQFREEKKAAAELDTFNDIKDSILNALEHAVDSTNPLDRYPSPSRVRELNGVTGKNSSRKGALELLLKEGKVVELALGEEELAHFPDKRALAGRCTYISIAPDTD